MTYNELRSADLSELFSIEELKDIIDFLNDEVSHLNMAPHDDPSIYKAVTSRKDSLIMMADDLNVIRKYIINNKEGCKYQGLRTKRLIDDE